MRRVFGGSGLPTLLRFAIVSLLYPMLMMLVIGIILLAAVFV